MYFGGTKNTNGMSVTRTNGTWLLVGTPTFANLTCTSISGLSMSGGATITGTLTLSGSNSTTGRLYISPDQFGSSYTFTAANIAFSNVDLEGCRATGAANWDISAITGLSGDAGNNTGITFTPAATQTWSGTSGGNWSANAWTTRVPLPQDDVIINSAFSASQTITANMSRLGNNIDFTGSTGSPTLLNNTGGGIYGTLTLIAGMTVSGTIGMVLYNNSAGATTKTFYQNGATVTNSGTWRFRSSNATSTYELGGTVNMPSAILNLDKGIFNTNNNTITANRWGAANSNTMTMNMGTSTLNLSGTTPVNFLGSPLTYNGTDATINILSGAAAKTFEGLSKSFGILNYVVSGSTGSLSITGSNTFKEINFRDATNARSLLFTAGTTTTITNAFGVQGTAGKLMTIGSITAASHTLTDASGVVSCDYMSISRSTATGGASWYAGANSTNGGNNTGWIFTKAPGKGSLMLMGVGS
jgi:hypothetical protein